MSEKPLNARVAEALGCKPVPPGSGPYPRWECGCGQTLEGTYPHGFHDSFGCDINAIAGYDSDWNAAGPLMEQFGLCVSVNCGEWVCFDAANGHEAGAYATATECIAQWVAQHVRDGKVMESDPEAANG